MRSPLILSTITVIGLSLGLAYAQQVDQSTRQQIERLGAMQSEDFEKHDAAGIARLYTRDGVLVAPAGIFSGQQQIQQHYTQVFKSGLHEQITTNLVSPLGKNEAIAIGEYHVTGQGKNGPVKIGGRWTAVYVREGGKWETRLATAVPFNSPAAANGGMAAPSGSAR